jgi:hypothetical protein
MFLLWVAVTGCDTGVDIPDVVREPQIVGEVLTREPVVDQGPSERRYLYDLAGGDMVDLDLNSALRVGDGPAPDEGFLLLYGTEPDGVWLWAGPLRDDPVTGRQCAYMEGRALEEQDSIVFEIGLRLPKAPDFDPAEQVDGEYTAPDRVFCIDEHGEVSRYGA